MKLIFVHGRSQGGKDADVLKQTWVDAFDEGLKNAGLSRPPGLEIALPFYGDALDALVKELDAPLVEDVVEKGAAGDDAEVVFREEFLQELADGNGITQEQIKEFYDEDVREKGVLNWKWVHAILKALDRHKELSDFALDSFTRDVYVYLTNAGVRRRIDAMVAKELTDEPCVVVGHSLGSIVAYNVLHNHEHRVPGYITVGSPLAIKAVKTRLRTIQIPKSTLSWSNARDAQDVVALFPLDADNFATDRPISNYNDVDNDTDDQHGIVGYLPDKWVARSIHEALTG
ncbi:MAG: alpha/beta hydrolase [Phycisphaerae bacterium]|jgi:hypothetical protein|nr:alpha/beta hydrolase [Phycisphaerae bacterium]